MTAHEILLVEDNPDDAELTAMALAEAGLEAGLTVITDGQQALDRLFDTSIPLPDLLMLDLKLPKVSGLDVLRRLRAHDRTRLQRVVVLTTSAEDGDLYGAFDSGVNAYVRKPVDSAAFADAVRYLGLFWLGVSLPPPTHRP